MPDERFWGKAADRDVILFIFETGPARSLDLAGDLGPFPSLRALVPRSFVAINHHSTYPYTSDALFSIFSSLYPPRSIRLQMKNHPEALHTGLMRRLADHGYATRAYTPFVARFEEDEKMFEQLGIQRHFIAEQAGEVPQAVYMLNRQSNAAHRSKTLDFPPDSMLPPGLARPRGVVQTLDLMDRLQRRWLNLPAPSR